MGLHDIPLFPEQASNFAVKVDALFFAILAVVVFFTVLVMALVIVFSIQYRRGSKAKREPMSHRTAMTLEITWTVIPTVLGFGMFLWAAALYQEMWTAPHEATDIYVVGKQWMWKLQHPNGKREINELHIPIGRPVRLVMTSQDVIHSFYVPAFRTKMDVVPGRYQSSWFVPTKIGKYHLFCAEYCGNQHAKMGGWVYVMPPAEFAKWLSGTQGEGGSLAERGEKDFNRFGCVTCHKEDATGRAPSFKGLYGSVVRLEDGRGVKAEETYIRESILDPRAKVVAGYEPVMPTFKNQVSDDQIVELIAYIKSLSGNSSAGNNSAALNKQEKMLTTGANGAVK
jgi:cytochrome c oxidase subunit 2